MPTKKQNTNPASIVLTGRIRIEAVAAILAYYKNKGFAASSKSSFMATCVEDFASLLLQQGLLPSLPTREQSTLLIEEMLPASVVPTSQTKPFDGSSPRITGSERFIPMIEVAPKEPDDDLAERLLQEDLQEDPSNIDLLALLKVIPKEKE